jgi:dihydrofolate reductase
MKLTVTTFLTLDGVYQGPGGPDEDRSDGFDQGGWVVPFSDEAFGAFITDAFGHADAFLLGRLTYQNWAGIWPAMGDQDPVSTALNRLPKFVASTTLTGTEWAGTSLLTGDLGTAVGELKEQPGRELQVHGSGRLVRSLAALDLVDTYRLMVFPVVLGSGRRLFEPGCAPVSFRLASSVTSSTGAMLQTYERAGAVEHGTASD